MSDAEMFIAIKQYERFGKITPCAECKYWRSIPDTIYGTCTKTRHNGSVMQALDFCSLAEPRKEAEE